MTTLGYWRARGYGQPLRLLLAYLGVEFINKTYSLDGAEWFEKDKKELGIPLPNLPYLIDGDIKLTESSVISYYLIRKYKHFELLGQNKDGSYSEKEISAKQILEIVTEFRNALYNDTFNAYYKFEDIKEKSEKTHTTTLKKILNHLGNKDFLEGTLTYADFVFYEDLLYFKHIFPQAEIPLDYIQRFENLERIKHYHSLPDTLKNFE